jgi:hypothetical protein
MSIASIIGAWTFGLLIPSILLATVYDVLRDVRELNRLKAPDESTGTASSGERISLDWPTHSSIREIE